MPNAECFDNSFDKDIIEAPERPFYSVCLLLPGEVAGLPVSGGFVARACAEAHFQVEQISTGSRLSLPVSIFADAIRAKLGADFNLGDIFTAPAIADRP